MSLTSFILQIIHHPQLTDKPASTVIKPYNLTRPTMYCKHSFQVTFYECLSLNLRIYVHNSNVNVSDHQLP